MGEMFITYEVLFAMEFLKIDSNGQMFFVQGERDHFPVPNPYLTKVEDWENQDMWKLNTPLHCRVIDATSIQGEFRKRNMPSPTLIYDPAQDCDFGVIEPFQQGERQQNAQEGGHPKEEEVEGHRCRNKADRNRPQPVPQDEFQANTSTRLGEMFSYMQNMSQTWDNRYAQQQQWNVHNSQSWEPQGEWWTAEQQFWEAQRLQDVQQVQQIAELQRMAAEAREERMTMSGDITYLIDAFNELSTRFPPPQDD